MNMDTTKMINIHDTLPLLLAGNVLVVYHATTGNHILRVNDGKVEVFQTQLIVLNVQGWNYVIPLPQGDFTKLDYLVEIRATYTSLRAAVQAIRANAQQFLRPSQQPAQLEAVQA